MKGFLCGPLCFQGLLMIVDEFYFHHRRGLGKWERVGHPLDTLSVLLCFGWVLWIPLAEWALMAFVGLAIASCLLVTKDEWVHARECRPEEMWLHAVLFILHPVILGALGWVYSHPDLMLELRGILVLQVGVLGAFMIYQILYWNWFRVSSQEVYDGNHQQRNLQRARCEVVPGG